jgi:Putative exonuclease SbcCD, C subunit
VLGKKNATTVAGEQLEPSQQRDFYVFRSSESGTHSDLIDLVRESRRPDFQLPLFGSQEEGDATDTPVSRAVRRIEEILLNPDAKTDEIEDPRKYFNFELYIYDDQGRIRSSLTSRAGTGSGGEGQLPFYIAIGASLAATYQNRRTGESGLSSTRHSTASTRRRSAPARTS